MGTTVVSMQLSIFWIVVLAAITVTSHYERTTATEKPTTLATITNAPTNADSINDYQKQSKAYCQPNVITSWKNELEAAQGCSQNPTCSMYFDRCGNGTAYKYCSGSAKTKSSACGSMLYSKGCCKRFLLNSTGPALETHALRFGWYNRSPLPNIHRHFRYKLEDGDGIIMWHKGKGWRAYAGEPENLDNAFTGQINFRCKYPCIDSCLKNGGNKEIKFIDSDKPKKDWFSDESVRIDCQDADAVCDTNKTNECAEKEISNTCYTTPNKNESCSCGFEPECGVNMRCTGSNDNIAAPNDWNAKCKVCVDIRIITKSKGDEVSWTFGTCKNSLNPYTSHNETIERCCLLQTKNELECKDSGNDGWKGGFLEINNRRFCEDLLWSHSKKDSVDLSEFRKCGDNKTAISCSECPRHGQNACGGECIYKLTGAGWTCADKACPKIWHTQIYSANLKQDIRVTTEAVRYGVWNGSEIVGIEYQVLIFVKEDLPIISSEKFLLKKDGLPLNISPRFTFIIDSTTYQENEEYIPYVLWKRYANDGLPNKQLETYLKLDCREGGDNILTTDQWMCNNISKRIPINSVCDGYIDTKNDCNDTDYYSDESNEVCSVDLPYHAIGVVIGFVVIGIFAFSIPEFFISRSASRCIKKNQTSDVELPLRPLNETPSMVNKLLDICRQPEDENSSNQKDDSLEKGAKELYHPCHNGVVRKNVFQLMYTLSRHAPFKNTIMDLGQKMVKMESDKHNDKKSEYMQCLRVCRGETSYISKFVKDIIDKGTCPSRFMRKLRNLLTFKSDQLNLRIRIICHFVKAFASLGFFYKDHIMDMALLKIIFYIDTKILTEDDDPTSEFHSVGGVNFKVVAFYMIFVLVVSEMSIYAYMYKKRNVFSNVFNVNSGQTLYNWLIIVFPVHFTLLKSMVTNIKLAIQEQKLNRILKNKSDGEDERKDVPIMVYEVAQDIDMLMKQLYHLHGLESEIQLFETALERMPQSIIQGSMFILMIDFKRLELLSDTVFGLDLKLVIVVFWSIQVFSMGRSCMVGIHRKRYPIAPGIAGSILQTLAIACLVVPKMFIISASLLNCMHFHPVLYAADLCLIALVHRLILKNKVDLFDVLIISVAPMYYKLDKGDNQENSHTLMKMIVNGRATLVLHLMSLALYFTVSWILRETVFFYNIQLENNANKASFLENLTTNKNNFPTHWLTILAIYLGGTLLYCVLTCMYYRFTHPWGIGSSKKGNNGSLSETQEEGLIEPAIQGQPSDDTEEEGGEKEADDVEEEELGSQLEESTTVDNMLSSDVKKILPASKECNPER